MKDTNKLLEINELQEVQYFSVEQKEFLKDYQFSYILQNYCVESDDDCGHSITKIAVVENNGYIKDIGIISIETVTFCSFDGVPTLFGSDAIERYISSDNISGFPSYCSKTTRTIPNDDRKEVFDKLGILDDVEQWFTEKAFTEELVNCDDAAIKYIEDRFGRHIFCDKCKSMIPSYHWKNYGLFRVSETHEMDGDSFDIEREYFDMQCPICMEHKEVDANEHIELFDSDEFKSADEQNGSQKDFEGFGTAEVSDIDLQNSFDEFKQNPFDEFKDIGPKACSICGKMFCEHRYPF